MENFIYDIPTKIYFGKGQIEVLKEVISEYGKRVLLVYGGGSIKQNGIYNKVISLLEDKEIEIYELSGVEPNPRIETVRKGVDFCRKHKIDVVLAIGGGSSIDCAKVISAGADYDGDAWDLVKNPSLIKKALPLIAILTIAATGSEMDHIAVISNLETKEKIGTRHPLMRPKASIMDPTYTFSVSPYQCASGTSDIMSHIMESYFSKTEAFLQDRVAEALLRTCIHYGVKALEDPNDYEARANLMWASSWAINDFLKLGKPVQWCVHPIEHQLSAVYDITHGVGLAILTPHWMEYVLNDQNVEKFAQFAHNVWDVKEKNHYSMAKEGIQKLKDYYQSLHLQTRLRDVGVIDQSQFEEMAEKAEVQIKGSYEPLSKDDIVNIYKAAW